MGRWGSVGSCVGCVRGGLALIFRLIASVGIVRPVTHHQKDRPHFPPLRALLGQHARKYIETGKMPVPRKMPIPPRCPFHPPDQTVKMRCTLFIKGNSPDIITEPKPSATASLLPIPDSRFPILNSKF
ncbi:hypothetical protein [Moorena producens]|uniref:hypothetical protein n=1 Tax=Moorena producens TaxID=1155739 RepID=UPI0011EA6EE5|nr:hypothetical protein [Moorena producens]